MERGEKLKSKKKKEGPDLSRYLGHNIKCYVIKMDNVELTD